MIDLVCCRMVIAMGYYGLSLNSDSLGGNIFLNFVLGGLVEFPAYTVCFICNKLGRKGPYIFGTTVGGLACIGVVLVDYFLKGERAFKTLLQYIYASELLSMHIDPHVVLWERFVNS